MEKSLYELLLKEVKSLTRKTSNCSSLLKEEKEDIQQNTLFEIVKKINEGVLSKDFNEIKNYTFITLRNFCIRKQMKRYNTELTDPEEFYNISNGEVLDQENKEYRDYLYKIISNLLNGKKYSDTDREVMKMVMSGDTDQEIKERFGFKEREYGKLLFRVKRGLKADYERPVRYVIKNVNDSNINHRCNDVHCVKSYLGISQRQLNYQISTKRVDKNGYYVNKIN
jgi:hypothetical protein